MSISVNQILSDAKRLVNRLREQESTANTIISQSNALYTIVSEMSEYDEEESEQNVTNQLRSRPSVVLNVQQENKHIRDLQLENRELRELLEEHQSVLQLIMSRYRQQVTHLVCSGCNDNGSHYANSGKELQKMADSICQIADVMKQSVRLDDVCYSTKQERLTELMTENKGLRELLDISSTFGSLQAPLNTPDTQDKEIQTET